MRTRKLNARRNWSQEKIQESLKDKLILNFHEFMMYYYHEQNRTVGKQDDSSHTVTIIFCFRDFSQI